eukprot:2685484-Prorocentrum_lima.AAC.1
MVTVSDETVPAPEARAWLDCESALHLSVHAGRASRSHRGFLDSSPAHVGIVGVLVPWPALVRLPPGTT